MSGESPSEHVGLCQSLSTLSVCFSTIWLKLSIQHQNLESEVPASDVPRVIVSMDPTWGRGSEYSVRPPPGPDWTQVSVAHLSQEVCNTIWSTSPGGRGPPTSTALGRATAQTPCAFTGWSLALSTVSSLEVQSGCFSQDSTLGNRSENINKNCWSVL